jgi:hypothetical protein
MRITVYFIVLFSSLFAVAMANSNTAVIENNISVWSSSGGQTVSTTTKNISSRVYVETIVNGERVELIDRKARDTQPSFEYEREIVKENARVKTSVAVNQETTTRRAVNERPREEASFINRLFTYLSAFFRNSFTFFTN